MAIYVLAPLADADMEEIWFYVAQYDSGHADTYIYKNLLRNSHFLPRILKRENDVPI